MHVEPAAVVICFIVGVTAGRILVVESLLRAFGVTPAARAVAGHSIRERGARKT